MKRRTFTAEEKTKLVLEMIRGEHEINEIAARESISPNLLRNWKSEFLEKASLVFDQKRDQRLKDELEEKKKETERLAKKVGQLTMEVDFLKEIRERKWD